MNKKNQKIALLIPCHNESKTIVRLFKEYKPTVFFRLLSLLFLIISLIFAVLIFVEYFKTGLILRYATLLFSKFMLLISILMFVYGIILEVVMKKNRQLF